MVDGCQCVFLTPEGMYAASLWDPMLLRNPLGPWGTKYPCLATLDSLQEANTIIHVNGCNIIMIMVVYIPQIEHW